MSAKDRKRAYDEKRKNAPYRKWYKLPLWQSIRTKQLTEHPLCERHLMRGSVVAASTVNHKVPHKGDWQKFISGPFESLCKACHDGPVQSEERRGYMLGCDSNGRPVDPDHPWNVRT